jgi:APA family basic amino acid/polyamine antiporter
MSTDGLLPKIFSDLHPKFRTPYKSNIVLFVFVGLFAAFVPVNVAGDLTSIGTLFAFVLVCLGIIILRKKDPNLKRPFKTPLVPLVPILGMLVCTAMIVGLPGETLVSALVWMVLGLVIYFSFSKNNSKLNKGDGH